MSPTSFSNFYQDISSFLNKKYFLLLLASVALVLFIYLRWYAIDKTLFFQNDMGRDFLVLLDWENTGKPPLLGPQTNFIPFNQSAFYFYFFFPLFILTNHSFYTTNLTLSLMYVVSFLLGLYVLKNNKPLLRSLTLAALIFAIHPQAIIQNRYIWNPSFVPLFLTASFFFFLHIQKNFSNKYLALFSLASAFAVGMSVSAIPAVISFLALGTFIFRKSIKQVIKLWLAIILAHCFVFFPFILFEIKYQFQITTRLLSQTKLETLPISESVVDKFLRLTTLLLPGISNAVIILIGILGITLLLTYMRRKSLNKQNVQALILFLITILLIALAPITLESHYIFGALTFIVLLVATLPRAVSLIIVIGAMSVWLHPARVNSYFNPAPRAINMLNPCFSQFCSNHPEPLFVSVQSNFHKYHYGPEFRYLMKNNGCSVKNIEDDSQDAQYMAVVVDGGTFVYPEDSYDELSKFGTAAEIGQASCSENLNIHILKKI